MKSAIKCGVYSPLAALALMACAGEIDRRDELGLEEEGVRSEVVELKAEAREQKEPVVEREAVVDTVVQHAERSAQPSVETRGALALVSYDPKGEYTVQVGGYRDAATANALVRELNGSGYPAYAIARPGSKEVRVRIGYFTNQVDAERFGQRFKADRAMEYWVDKRANE